jgi:hypothetical protein
MTSEDSKGIAVRKSIVHQRRYHLGWGEARIPRISEHYHGQTEGETTAEDDAVVRAIEADKETNQQ